MTSPISPRPLVLAAAAMLTMALAAPELLAQPPAPAQPATPPAQPGAPPAAPPPITPGQPTAPPAPATATPPTTTTPSPATPTTPSEPTPGTTTAPTAPPKGTGAATPRVLTNEIPPPGTIGPAISKTGCVRRIERLDTDSATVADVINRPMTAYVLDPSGGKAEDERRVTGLIAANGSVRLDSVVGKAVEVSGTLRSPMVIGSPTKGADSPAITELQPMIVRSMKPAGVQCQ